MDTSASSQARSPPKPNTLKKVAKQIHRNCPPSPPQSWRQAWHGKALVTSGTITAWRDVPTNEGELGPEHCAQPHMPLGSELAGPAEHVGWFKGRKVVAA